MDLTESLAKTSLKAIGHDLGLGIGMVNGQIRCSPLDPDDPRYAPDFIMPSPRMVDTCRADDFPFFQPFIGNGQLTVEQMHHAASRYFLGKTRSGCPIFWMMADPLCPLDAHIGSDTWLSHLLKQREPMLDFWQPLHCLFGLHLLHPRQQQRARISSGACSSLHPRSSRRTIGIVESESTAVVLSELFPDLLWMAYVTPEHLEPALFAPLQGHNVILYPRTDPTQSNYLYCYDLVSDVHRCYPTIHITVDSILEEHATDEQKRRCIDLLEFLQES